MGSELQLWQPDDPAITGAVESKFAFDSRFGLMVFGQSYQFGLAVSNLLQTPFGLESEPSNTRNRGVRHYALTGRYDYNVDQQLKIQPAVMLRFTEITPVQLDMHVRALYDNRYWGWSWLPSRRCLCLVSGRHIPRNSRWAILTMRGTGSVANLSPNTHEITVSYVMPRRGTGFNRRGIWRAVCSIETSSFAIDSTHDFPIILLGSACCNRIFHPSSIPVFGCRRSRQSG